MAGPDGNLWVGTARQQVDRITPTGQVTVFTLSAVPASTDPIDFTIGPDHKIWFVGEGGSRVGRIDMAGHTSLYNANFPQNSTVDGAEAFSIASGPDGRLWIARRRRGSARSSSAPPSWATPSRRTWRSYAESAVGADADCARRAARVTSSG